MQNTGRGGILLQSMDVALEPTKLLLSAAGLIVTLVVSVAIVIVSNIVDASTPDFSPTAWLLRFVALVVFWLLATLFIGAVTRLSYIDLTEDASHGWRSGLTYARSHWLANFFAPMLLALAVLVIAIIEIIAFGFARIPYLGELIFAIIYLPAVLLNVLVVLIFLFGTILLFPAIAIDGFSAATAPARVIALVRRHLGSIVGTMLIAIFIAIAATLLILAIVTATILFTARVSSFGMGSEKTTEILAPEFSALASGPGGLIGGFFQAFNMESSAPTVLVARLVVSLAVLVLFAAIYAFPLTFLLTAACSVYLSHETSDALPETTTRSGHQDVVEARHTVTTDAVPLYAPPPSRPEPPGPGSEDPPAPPDAGHQKPEPPSPGPVRPSDWRAPTVPGA